MRKLMTSVIALSTIYLNGCATVILPTRDDHERCVANIIIPLKESYCRCHTYRWSPEKVGRVSESVNKPIEHCDKLIGKSPQETVNDVLFLEEMFEAVDDANNQSSNPVPLLVFPEIETREEILNLAEE